ncbi:hypothetical protein BAG01nite_49250 [Brevibacillus agri]|uniref:Thioredoxin domain-containing protein n=2 Tax=Brevibacillus TaxID=55080 RepID=A0A3M8AN36_9BACL|nr:hypothetical protein [Brevibacillus agri]MED3501547.1 hypothetical protein [Brevibacillus agri]QAV11626.1 hypothetical protein BA6348_01810 [Brevibacillus agri]RNB52612.1 hypothetical protein EB820_18710 [Brevibacillus agri]GED28823.1 hypothetical protein BAG01nite_49250 [Brevibacillus agri]
MEQLLQISLTTLWIIVILLILILIRFFKMIGNTQKKRSLSGSELGLAYGTKFPVEILRSIEDKEFSVSNPEGDGTLLIVTSYSCSPCRSVYPIQNTIVSSYPRLKVINIMISNSGQAWEISDKFGLDSSKISLITMEQLHTIGISTFPYSYLLTSDGTIISKGVTNFKEHFDLLIANQKTA